MPMWHIALPALCAAAIAVIAYLLPADLVLKGVSSDRELTYVEYQLVLTAFCASPLPGKILADPKFRGEDGSGAAEVGYDEYCKSGQLSTGEGDLSEDDYSKESIYSLFYGAYSLVSDVLYKGQTYEFSFNTWGFGPSIYHDNDPQKYGKTAYASLVQLPPVKEYVSKVDSPSIVEIGCGAGAGANLISSGLLPRSRYLAVDMQKAAINTCKRKFEKYNAALSCVQAPGGVGVNGRQVRDATGEVVPDGSFDVAIISETHIAEVAIDEETKMVFAEILRVLKPGGLFLWGNALPTRVWHEGYAHLTSTGFERAFSSNVTAGAVDRGVDERARADAYAESLTRVFPVFAVAPTCKQVVHKLLHNFWRIDGTALQRRLETGCDSYMQEVYRKL